MKGKHVHGLLQATKHGSHLLLGVSATLHENNDVSKPGNLRVIQEEKVPRGHLEEQGHMTLTVNKATR